jgi:hypothetical protein
MDTAAGGQCDRQAGRPLATFGSTPTGLFQRILKTILRPDSKVPRPKAVALLTGHRQLHVIKSDSGSHYLSSTKGTTADCFPFVAFAK